MNPVRGAVLALASKTLKDMGGFRAWVSSSGAVDR